MARTREGSVYVDKSGKIYARVQFLDEQNKPRDIKRRAKTRTEAKEKIKQILNELAIGGETLLDGEKMTFGDLCDAYAEAKLFAAKFVGDRKVAGLRELSGPMRHVGVLRAAFGQQRLRSITHNDIAQWKTRRLDEPTIHQRQRSITSVNRDLETMRAMFHFAHREGWILQNPFQRGTSLISKADETKRDRILTADEEVQLLAACTGKRSHLRAIIICALDTGLRRNELLNLTWADINLGARTIYVRARNTKTLTARTVGITARLHQELLPLQGKPGRIFGITDSFKKAWLAACADAEIDDLHFHDLRHTAITRMIQSNMPASLVMKISGHTQASTFARYVNPDQNIATQIADALDRWQQSGTIVESQTIQ